MATTEETNKAQFRRTLEEMFNQGNLAVADELIAPDCLNHEVPPDMNNRGPESIRQVVMMLRTAFPDLHFTIEELVAEGNTVAARVTLSGPISALFWEWLRPAAQFGRPRCISCASETARASSGAG